MSHSQQGVDQTPSGSRAPYLSVFHSKAGLEEAGGGEGVWVATPAHPLGHSLSLSCFFSAWD